MSLPWVVGEVVSRVEGSAGAPTGAVALAVAGLVRGELLLSPHTVQLQSYKVVCKVPPPVLILCPGVLAHRGLTSPLSQGHAGRHSEGKHQAASPSLLLSSSSYALLPPDEHDGGDAVEEDLCG